MACTANVRPVAQSSLGAPASASGKSGACSLKPTGVRRLASSFSKRLPTQLAHSQRASRRPASIVAKAQPEVSTSVPPTTSAESDSSTARWLLDGAYLWKEKKPTSDGTKINEAENGWKGLIPKEVTKRFNEVKRRVNPSITGDRTGEIDDALRKEIIMYGEMAQLTYDSVDLYEWSRYRDRNRYTEEDLLRDEDVDHLRTDSCFEQLPGQGYKAEAYICASEQAPLIRELRKKTTGQTLPNNVWFGYIAYSEKRQDIVVAWRGTLQPAEWVADAEVELIPYQSYGETKPSPKGDSAKEAWKLSPNGWAGVAFVGAAVWGSLSAFVIFRVLYFVFGIVESDGILGVLFNAGFGAIAALPTKKKLVEVPKKNTEKATEGHTGKHNGEPKNAPSKTEERTEGLKDATQKAPKESEEDHKLFPLWLREMGLGTFVLRYALAMAAITTAANWVAESDQFLAVDAVVFLVGVALPTALTAAMEAWESTDGVQVHKGFYELYSKKTTEPVASGTKTNGTVANGTEANRMDTDGAAANGTAASETATNETKTNETNASGTKIDGTTSNGTDSKQMGRSPREMVLDTLKGLLTEEYLKEHPVRTISVTGHSLGGAMAVLSSYDIVESGANKNENGELIPVGCFAYEAPRVGNPAFVASFQEKVDAKKLAAVRVVNKPDIVTQVPKAFFLQNVYYINAAALFRSDFLVSLVNAVENLGYLFGLPSAFQQVGALEIKSDSREVDYLKKAPWYDLLSLVGNFHNLEVNLHLVSGYQRDTFTRDFALCNKSADALDARVGIAPNWFVSKIVTVEPSPEAEVKPSPADRGALIEPYSDLPPPAGDELEKDNYRQIGQGPVTKETGKSEKLIKDYLQKYDGVERDVGVWGALSGWIEAQIEKLIQVTSTKTS